MSEREADDADLEERAMKGQVVHTPSLALRDKNLD